ncbi:hypothetical protein C4B63_272g27 [Trypanosoma cruzi]|uniref:Uncharacterized protein n=1 Tax=Trypanosoma cruzi TaxID=5693 RepID=A0A2V2UM85_TRYCR|nr:hypothetical protein C4B63_272g27 [Trypanosoma cruzi]
MPSYLPDTVVLQLCRDGEAEFADYMDANSLAFVALGDAGRPALFGIDAAAQLHHEGARRALVSAVGIVSSIRRRRLRIPFGNSELSELLRRAYNTEKGNRNSSLNGFYRDGFIGSRLFGCRVGGGIVPLSFHDLSCWYYSWLNRNWIRHKGSCR